MPKPCDACQVATAVVYCRADAAFLCIGCDQKVHRANKLASRHERVWMCEVCELAPAVVTCRADAAALCVSCDRDIHSANPLAQRHERVPVTPFYDCDPHGRPAELSPDIAVASSASPASAVEESHIGQHTGFHSPSHGCHELRRDAVKSEEDDVEAASWILPGPQPGAAPPGAHAPRASDAKDRGGAGIKGSPVIKPEVNSELYSDIDPFLDLECAKAVGSHPVAAVVAGSFVLVHNAGHGGGASSASPSAGQGSFDSQPQQVPCSNGRLGSYGGSTLSHSMSSSSMDVGVVPESSEISTGLDAAAAAAAAPHFEFPPPHVLHVEQLQPLAREARVLRYREKRKNRKFEKTIRYASRKAYAESRPRVKGRFAKRCKREQLQEATDAALFSAVTESSFGVVPSVPTF